MANVKISELPLATTAPNSAIEVPIVQSGVTKRIEAGVFVTGNTAPVIASKAEVNWQRDDAGSTYPPEDFGGLWSTEVYYRNAVSAEFDAANSPVTTPLASPAVTMLLASHNTGSDAIVLPLQTIGGVHVSGKEATAGNFITYSTPGTTNVKMKGLEIDLQPHSTSTISDSFGLAINAFTKEIPGAAIYVEGIFGGRWGTGVQVGNLSNIGAALAPGPLVNGVPPSMGTLIDTGTANYQIEAIKLNNTHKVRWQGTGGAHAKVFVDGSNFWRFVLGSNSLVWRDNTDTVTLMSLSTTGDLALENGGTIRFNSSLSSSSASAGGASALPATPAGYLTINIAGTNRKIPYYA